MPMHTAIEAGLLNDEAVGCAEHHVFRAWVHALAFLSESASQRLEPTGGLIRRTAPSHHWVRVFGGFATLDEVRDAGLLIDGGPDHWLVKGYSVESEGGYVSRAAQLRDARQAKKARLLQTSVTDLCHTEEKGQERNGSPSKGKVRTEGQPPTLTGDIAMSPAARAARAGGRR
jgi:hypothetical protein